MSANDAITQEFATQLTFIADELHRVVAVLVDRSGQVTDVMIGDSERVYLPDVGRQRAGAGRFRGVRLIRTDISKNARQVELSRDDYTDLSKLNLDLVMVVGVGHGGYPGPVAWAHLIPENPDKRLWESYNSPNPREVQIDFQHFISELESEFQRKSADVVATGGQPAILVYVSTYKGRDESTELAEMRELCYTAGVDIVDVFIQRRSNPHPKYAVGPGKIEDLTLRALQLDADLLIFGQDLSPGQHRSITESTELKVIDRTQLILDIFAQRATSRDGKVQVELAQLKYNLPRLRTKSTGMSRLTGGIGGRGPGETKLEINRRRANDRIRQLEKQIATLSKQRQVQRGRRSQNNVPTISVVGYTNAGKSTLLNTLTNADVLSEDKLFATLHPTSRRLRFPDEREIILTDTVGFIHDLPKDLVAAFKATLEELDNADLLIHLVDISDDDHEEKVAAVNQILTEIGLDHKEQLLVYNKIDLVPTQSDEPLFAHRPDIIAISALERKTIEPLVDAIEARLFRQAREQATAHEMKYHDTWR